jgi:hypothetical protein
MGVDRRDLTWLGGLSAVLLVVLLWPYVVDGFRFGVGPDVPVYLWWTRVGASEGLSTVGSRPGAPALAAALGGTLSLSAAAATAGLASALGVAVGGAAAALVRAAGGRASKAWLLAGLLAGVFSVHLVAGYLGNLVLAATFVAAAACLAGDRRSWWAAALLLAGGGLAHPPFLAHAIVVLWGAAALAWRAGARDEARDIALAVTAGGLVAGAGVLATVAGPGPIHAETSRDGYLRRAGLDAQLIDAYRERFRLRAARYVQWISVPLAVAGTTTADGFLQRFLISWLVAMTIGIPVGYVTGWLPPDRLVTFGFAVPIAAALGLLWVHRRLGGRPWLARALFIVLAGWMIVGALLAWGKQRPFVTTREVARTQSAMRYAEAITEAGTPIVILVDDDDDTASFLAARTANIFRAAAKPDRARDIYIFLGRATDFFEDEPTRRANPEYTALSKLTLASIPDDPNRLVVAARPFYRASDAVTHPRMHPFVDGIWVSDDVDLVGLRGEDEPRRLSWRPSNPAAITFATLSILAVLAVLGIGFALMVFDDLTTAIATAPAFGAAALTLTAVALDRLGLRLAELPVALAASALAGLGSFALLLVMKRQRDPEASA